MRRPLVIAGLVALLAVALVVAAAGRDTGPVTAPLDVRSTADDGTRALADLLRGEGLAVRSAIDVPADGAPATVLVLDDELTSAQRTRLLAWVDAGGALVVADPDSSLHPGGGVDAGAGPAFGRWPRGTCTIERLAAVEGLDELQLDDDLAYPLTPDDAGCFGNDRRAFVLERPQGAGRLTALGGPSPFLNRNLDRAGNAGLALALFERDDRRELVVLESDLLNGDKTLAQLVPSRVWMALAQLGVAFLALAWWRSRRLGAPVLEDDPVTVRGSGLVVAAGALAARAGHTAHAADRLRGDARRSLATSLGVPESTPAAELDRLASARFGTASGTVGALLDGPPPTDDDGLVALAAGLDRLRLEVS